MRPKSNGNVEVLQKVLAPELSHKRGKGYWLLKGFLVLRAELKNERSGV